MLALPEAQWRNLYPAALAALALLLILTLLYLLFSSEPEQPLELTAAAPAVPEPEPAIQPPAAAAGEEQLRVYLAGAVQKPGVYALPPDARLVDALTAAGGGAETADLEAVNLALRVEDAAYYYIPARTSRPEIVAVTETGPANGSVTASDTRLQPAGAGGSTHHKTAYPPYPSYPSMPAVPSIAADPLTGKLPSAPVDPAADAANTPLDLNRASQAQLETLPGIGPARAAAIIAYRQQQGHFIDVAELTAVSGIGQGIYQGLQGLVTVGEAP